MRLGQVHGAGPLTRDELFQVSGFEFIGTGGQQGFNRAIGEQGAQRKRHVGRVEHFTASGANGFGQALATKVGRVLQALPTAFCVLLIGLFEAGRGGHPAAVVEGRVFVALPVQGRDHILVELGAFFKHRLRGFQTSVFKAGNLRNLVDAGQMLDVEKHVLQGGDVAHESLRYVFEWVQKRHRERCLL